MPRKHPAPKQLQVFSENRDLPPAFRACDLIREYWIEQGYPTIRVWPSGTDGHRGSIKSNIGRNGYPPRPLT